MRFRKLLLLLGTLAGVWVGWTGDCQPSASAQEAGAPATLAGKTFRSGPASVRFGQDGTFEISGGLLVPDVRGRYNYEDGVVTFTDPQDGSGSIKFPVRCRVEMDSQGFKLQAANQNCSQFDGLRFERAK